MNGLLWIAQIILAGIFLFAAAGKLFAYEKVVNVVSNRKGKAVTLTHREALLIALVEIIGTVGVLLPDHFQTGHQVTLAACALLGLLMVGGSIYHIRRGESAAPNVALFLLALFVIVGRWPR
jgi:uncharacterized membrane protein YphA (DoxX/SURF4 family)